MAGTTKISAFWIVTPVFWIEPDVSEEHTPPYLGSKTTPTCAGFMLGLLFDAEGGWVCFSESSGSLRTTHGFRIQKIVLLTTGWKLAELVRWRSHSLTLPNLLLFQEVSVSPNAHISVAWNVFGDVKTLITFSWSHRTHVNGCSLPNSEHAMCESTKHIRVTQFRGRQEQHLPETKKVRHYTRAHDASSVHWTLLLLLHSISFPENKSSWLQTFGMVYCDFDKSFLACLCVTKHC